MSSPRVMTWIGEWLKLNLRTYVRVHTRAKLTTTEIKRSILVFASFHLILTVQEWITAKRKEETKNTAKEEGEIVTAVAINFISRAFVLATYQLNCAVLHSHNTHTSSDSNRKTEVQVLWIAHSLWRYLITCTEYTSTHVLCSGLIADRSILTK